MKIIFSIFLITSIATHAKLEAKKTIPKVIYGEDNRVFYEESTNEIYKEWAKSTAVQIRKSKIKVLKSNSELKYQLNLMNLAETKNVCSDETFSDISSIGLCSGFLVGEDLLVTAGHCMSTSRDCEEAIWAFNFQKDSISSKDHILEGKDVYHCKKIINQQLSGVSYNDFAIIQLDRKVEGRAPLKFRTSGKVENDAELVVIGHPSGLPTMITDGAYIRNNDNDFYFVTNSDTFGGNSGSAVFNSKTGEVEGILVRGENDYVFDEEAECYRPYKCGIDECRGEDVTRITVIPELVPGMTPVEPEPTANQLIEFFQLWMTNMTGQQLYLLWFASLTSAEIIDMTIEQTMEQSYNLWIESLDPTELYELWYQYIFLFS